VLKDLEGTAIQQAFQIDKFHWDGKTPLAKMLQTASFKNHGSDPNAGSKPTYKNVTVTGISWTPPAPLERSPAKAGGAAAKPAGKGKGPAQKRKAGGLSLEGQTLDELMATKAGVDRQVAQMEERKKAEVVAEIKALEATLQADMDKLDPKAKKAKKSPAASPAKAAKAAASPAASPPASPAKAPAKAKAPAASPAKVESSGSEEFGSSGSSGEESGSSGEESGDEFSLLYQNFIAGKKTIIQHYTDVTGTPPAKSWPAKQMRSALIKEHYSIEQLRTLADDAGIDSRIKKLESLRTALSSHFSTYL